MGWYVVKKIGYGLLTVFGVVTIVFILFSVIPGDPAQMMLDQNENSEQLQIIRKKYGFDQPLHKQYFYYLNDLSPLSVHSRGQLKQKKYSFISIYESRYYSLILKWPYLRESFQNKGSSVTSIIANTLPSTLLLATTSICIAVLIGLLLGVILALYGDLWISRIILFMSTLGISLPSFFSAILFSWFFGFVLHHFTGLNMTGSLYEVDDLGRSVFIQWKNLILPSIVLGIRPLSVISQLMANSLGTALSSDYIRTARSKGLSEYRIITKHAIKNALNPVITAISGWFAGLLAGAVFVEYIFGWNGIGKEMVTAIDTKDLPVIMGMVLVIAVSFIIINIIVDMIYAYIDPRIRIY